MILFANSHLSAYLTFVYHAESGGSHPDASFCTQIEGGIRKFRGSIFWHSNLHEPSNSFFLAGLHLSHLRPMAQAPAWSGTLHKWRSRPGTTPLVTGTSTIRRATCTCRLCGEPTGDVLSQTRQAAARPIQCKADASLNAFSFVACLQGSLSHAQTNTFLLSLSPYTYDCLQCYRISWLLAASYLCPQHELHSASTSHSWSLSGVFGRWEMGTLSLQLLQSVSGRKNR